MAYDEQTIFEKCCADFSVPGLPTLKDPPDTQIRELLCCDVHKA